MNEYGDQEERSRLWTIRKNCHDQWN